MSNDKRACDIFIQGWSHVDQVGYCQGQETTRLKIEFRVFTATATLKLRGIFLPVFIPKPKTLNGRVPLWCFQLDLFFQWNLINAIKRNYCIYSAHTAQSHETDIHTHMHSHMRNVAVYSRLWANTSNSNSPYNCHIVLTWRPEGERGLLWNFN